MRILTAVLFLQLLVPSVQAQNIPSKIPRRSSTQLVDGFGANVNLPRMPRMPGPKRGRQYLIPV